MNSKTKAVPCIKILGTWILASMIVSCGFSSEQSGREAKALLADTLFDKNIKLVRKDNAMMEQFQLIDVQSVDSTIWVELKYASSDNFTGKALYRDLTQAYLQPDVALMLVQAQRYLTAYDSHLHLLIYDAARPIEVQQRMFDWAKTVNRQRYVANPYHAGLHNYAAAVDITIARANRRPLDMGTLFDHFGVKASILDEDSLLRQGVFTVEQIHNRRLLRKVMRRAGFRTASGEWWHFSACRLSEAKEKYQLITFENEH
jgi:D-alanyl-D-alanine dipeptidase